MDELEVAPTESHATQVAVGENDRFNQYVPMITKSHTMQVAWNQ